MLRESVESRQPLLSPFLAFWALASEQLCGSKSNKQNSEGENLPLLSGAVVSRYQGQSPLLFFLSLSSHPLTMAWAFRGN